MSALRPALEEEDIKEISRNRLFSVGAQRQDLSTPGQIGKRKFVLVVESARSAGEGLAEVSFALCRFVPVVTLGDVRGVGK